MPVLALAGGTSATLGRAITLGVLSLSSSQTKQQSNVVEDDGTSSETGKEDRWSIRILTRSRSSVPAWLKSFSTGSFQDEIFAHPRIQLEEVDYGSPTALISALQGVHTLMSLLFNPSPYPNKNQSTREIVLLHAAVAAGVKRFAPTAWGLPGLYWDNSAGDGGKGGGPRLEGLNADVWEACCAVMQKGEIECAKFNCGVFMNYLAWGFVDQDELWRTQAHGKENDWVNGYQRGMDELTEGVGVHGDMSDGSGSFLLSLQSAVAELPVRDDGGYPKVTMTTIRDVGRFVAASLLLPQGEWKKDMSMAGDTIDLRDLVQIAEELGGKKIQVQKFSKGELIQRLGEVSQLENNYVEALWLQFKILYCDDEAGKGRLRPVVNELCLDVKTETVRQFLIRCWRQKVI